jgi:hypothetical protein
MDSSITAEPEGTTSTAISVADRTRQQGHTRPLLAQPCPNRPAKTPSPWCSKPDATPPPVPSSHVLHLQGASAQCGDQPARPNPDGAQMGLDLGRTAPPATRAGTSPRGQRPCRHTEAHGTQSAEPDRRREESAPEPPPSAWGKTVCRRRRHKGFARRLLSRRQRGKEERGGSCRRERRRHSLASRRAISALANGQN